MVDFVVCGHLCVDLIPQMGNVKLKELPSPGKLFEVGALTFATGGAVSNTGLTLRKLGMDVALMGKVGDDFIGQATLTLIEQHGQDLTRFVPIDKGKPSSYTLVLSPENVDRIFLSSLGVNSFFGFEDVDFEVLQEAKFLHLGYPSILPRMVENGGAELEAIMARAKSLGVVTSLDMTLPDPQGFSGRVDWRGLFRRVLPSVDIFIPSVEEAVYCLRNEDWWAWERKVVHHVDLPYLSQMADELLEMGAVITGCKLGEYGMYLKTASAEKFGRLSRLGLDVEAWANAEVYKPAFEVQVVGTTGAGDSAYAGFLTSLLKGLNPEEALRMACAVGACNVEGADAVSGIRSWDEVQKRVQDGWKVREERIRGS